MEKQEKNLQNEIEAKTKEIQSLLTASRAVLKYSSFTESARVIFDEAKKITGGTAGYVALLSDDGSENEVLFLDAGGRKCSVDPSLPMPIRGLRAQSYYTNKAVYHNDFMKSEHVGFMPQGHVVMNNVMFAPLVIEGKTVGIIGLANKDGDFTDYDAKMAEAFGEFAAIALFNSRNLDKLNESILSLQKALSEVKTLRGIVPICASCKKIRNDDGYWEQVETYVHQHSEADFSHGMCPECYEKAVKDINKKK